MDRIFMIRSGDFGENFGLKFIFSLAGFLLCAYDYKTSRNRRKDYFYAWIVGTIIWTYAEFTLYWTGVRVYKGKHFFGLDISNQIWLTVPLQAMSEGSGVGISGLFFGDRIANKKWFAVFVLWLLSFIPFYARFGINYDNVNLADPDIPSRRDMCSINATIHIFILSSIAVIWYLLSAPAERKRGMKMYIVMSVWVGWWTLNEWITGKRWIEVGKMNYDDGTFSDLRRASPLLEFVALAYDYLIEVSLIYIPFLAIPYFMGLIKPEKERKKWD